MLISSISLPSVGSVSLPLLVVALSFLITLARVFWPAADQLLKTLPVLLVFVDDFILEGVEALVSGGRAEEKGDPFSLSLIMTAGAVDELLLNLKLSASWRESA